MKPDKLERSKHPKHYVKRSTTVYNVRFALALSRIRYGLKKIVSRRLFSAR